jgi:hypothetical protein
MWFVMSQKEPLIKYLVSFAVTVAAAISGYYAAYTGLRVELARKAEDRYVAELDIRLARLEATMHERFATRDDLSSFKNEVIAKLTAIETVIAGPNGSGLRNESGNPH